MCNNMVYKGKALGLHEKSPLEPVTIKGNHHRYCSGYMALMEESYDNKNTSTIVVGDLSIIKSVKRQDFKDPFADFLTLFNEFNIYTIVLPLNLPPILHLSI